MIGRADNNTLIYIQQLNTSNLGYFIMGNIKYSHNYEYYKNLKNGYLPHCSQHEKIITRIYSRIPRKKKRFMQEHLFKPLFKDP